MSTKLTVVMAVYNGMPFLPEAVESILCQSFRDFMFVIVNDGSTDGSLAYLRTLTDPRIVLLEQANQGQGAALNAGLRCSQSEYTAFMDADDISMPDRLRNQLEYMIANPDVVMAGTQIDFLAGRVRQRALSVPTHHEGIQERLLNGRAGLCHPSLMFRTRIALAAGGYPAWALGLDLEFCLRMCEQGRVANMDQVLYQYRFHANQTSSARFRGLIGANRCAAYRAVCRHKGLPEPSLETFLSNASWMDRWKWSAEAWQLVQYRTGRIQMANGSPLRGVFRLALLGMCRPLKTIGRVAQTVAASPKGPGN